MSTLKVLQLAEKFAHQSTMPPGPLKINQMFKEQRARLSEFYEHFFFELRRIIFRMESEIGTLRMRGFDHKMTKMLSEFYQQLITISKSVQEDKPYTAGLALVEYVLSRHTKSIIENLDFLAAHHLKVTNVDFVPTKSFKHPEIESIKKVIQLAEWAKAFMEANPLITIPSSPPIALPVGPTPAVDHPEVKIPATDATNPGSPQAKNLRDDMVGQ